VLHLKIESSLSITSVGSVRNTNYEGNKSHGEDAINQESRQENIQNEYFPGEKQFIEMIEKSNNDFKMTNSSLQFSIHEKTKQILVKIIDNNTKEVIKEIPPEKILDMVAAMLERTGLFVDKKA
jgi:flagellar protein FlaG